MPDAGAHHAAALAAAPPAVMLAQFADPGALLRAAAAVRAAGYQRFDCHSPFPIHGMDAAMGLKPSLLGWVAFAAAAAGGMTILGLQWWTSVVDYPLLIGGKPFFSLPMFIPITFEVVILSAALTIFGGVFIFTGLPRFHHPLFASDRFAKVTDDGFFLSVEAEDPRFDPSATRVLLEGLGASHVEVLSDR